MKWKIKNTAELIEKLDLEMDLLLKNYNVVNYTDLKRIAYSRKIPVLMDFFKNYKLLITMSKTPQWGPTWISRISNWLNKYNLTINYSPEKEQKNKNFTHRPSFFSYLESAICESCNTLNLNRAQSNCLLSLQKPQSTYVMFQKIAHKFDINSSRICNLDCTFFTSKNQCLATQSTPCVLEFEKNSDVLDYFKVFRRQSCDSTHLCEFYQVEYRKKYEGEDPCGALVADVKSILSSFGIDPKRIVVRKTRYSYTSPSFEFFYTLDDGTFIELCGGGILIPQILKKYPSFKEDIQKVFYLAAGFGAERLYSLVCGINRIKDNYNII
jgi:hypothetical protein